MEAHPQLKTRLTALLRQLADHDVAIDEDTDLIDELRLDSVKVLDLVLEIEDEFDVSIPLNSLADVRTMGDLARLIVHYGETD
ncbi:MAG: acyl carrier protein [Gammaproteobacteria bacterium]|nr:acyl carrier protein [Gammaproteobacteria bacterium]